MPELDRERLNNELTPEEQGEKNAADFLGFIVTAAFIVGGLIGYIVGVSS